jgi:hypothetical protein
MVGVETFFENEASLRRRLRTERILGGTGNQSESKSAAQPRRSGKAYLSPDTVHYRGLEQILIIKIERYE